MFIFCPRKNNWALAILLLMPAANILAQQKRIALTDLITASQKHLPVFLQKQALINSSKAIITDTRHSFLPQIRINDQINLGTDNSLAGSYLPLGINPSVSSGVRADNNLQAATGNTAVLYGEYELYNFGLNHARIENANAYLGLDQADLERELYLNTIQIARVYFDIQRTQYQLQVDKQNVNRYDSIFKVIQALALSGIKAGSDSSLAKAELSKARITFNQTQGNLDQLKEQMSFLTGIPATDFGIDTLSNSFQKNLDLVSGLPSDSLNNPLLDFYKKKTNIFISNEALIRKLYLPKILLGAGTWVRGSSIQYNDAYKSLATGLGYQRFNYMVGIGIGYNLFNGLYKKDKLNINKFQTQASVEEEMQERLSLNSSVLQANKALETNAANLLELPIQLQSAMDTYGQKLAQYKAGIISLIDLTNASFVLYRSQTDYIEAINDWYRAQLDKSAATGNLFQFIRNIK